MISIFPFKALRPVSNEKAMQVADLPYDVFTYEQAKKRIIEQPNSILCITRPDAFFDVEVSNEKRYQKAKEELIRLSTSTVMLEKEQQQAMYIYQLSWQGNTQTGLVCLSDIKDYEEKRIKKHEHTRPDKETERVNHMVSLGAQTGNVFLIYKKHEELSSLLRNILSEQMPLFDFSKENGVRHKVWAIYEEEKLNAIRILFEQKIEATYIADGHHRVAAAYRNFQQNPGANKFLTTLFSEEETCILSYNRAIRMKENKTKQNVLEALQDKFNVFPIDSVLENDLCMFLENQWYQLLYKNQEQKKELSKMLHADILQTEILSPLFEIHDPKKDPNIAFIGGVQGTQKLEGIVKSGEYDIAFYLKPVKVQELLEVADAEKMMPPKSTWFEPKLCDGLFIHMF